MFFISIKIRTVIYDIHCEENYNLDSPKSKKLVIYLLEQQIRPPFNNFHLCNTIVSIVAGLLLLFCCIKSENKPLTDSLF